ncbi:TetR/AcrR family transcriptional regulator [Mucilaginibacter sp.]|jgi:AcrR family transcriptional regulator|uniref:TetR/AcrR family transcriptional regulator n=1 Tax=Mucilaginibacter sp. TaxID=1882438 RepID=UPI003566697A
MSSNEKYDALIALCEDLFVTNGVSVVTMEDIAGSAGISKKTVYTYFTSEDDLVVMAIEGIIERLNYQLFCQDLSSCCRPLTRNYCHRWRDRHYRRLSGKNRCAADYRFPSTGHRFYASVLER